MSFRDSLRNLGRQDRRGKAERPNGNKPDEPVERSEPIENAESPQQNKPEGEVVMGEWEKSFSRRLGKLREAWSTEFQRVAEQEIQPAYGELEQFLNANGFSATQPQANAEMWSFRFSLGEDVYVLVSYKLRGSSDVEATTEIVVPGKDNLKPAKTTEAIHRVTVGWAENVFRQAMDQFLGELETTVDHESLQRA